MMMLRTKLQTRLLALLLMLSLLLTTGLFSSCQTVDPPEGEDTTEESTMEELETLEKNPCRASIEDNFEDNMINVYIQPFANQRQYTPEDFAEIGCIEVQHFHSLDKKKLWLFLTLDKHSKQNVLDMIEILDKRQDVVRAEPNFLFQLATLPNDPMYSEYDEVKRWGLDKIMAPDAWDYTRGSSSVYVGVIDSGIDLFHEDLENRYCIELSDSFVGGMPFYDNIGHGTAVAGIIGAQGNDGIGYVGVCWDVQLVSLKATNTIDLSAAKVCEAVQYAESVGIDILCCAFGGYELTTNVLLCEQAIADFSGLYVSAAGNQGVNTDDSNYTRYPRCNSLPNAIVVGASTENDRVASFSNHGKTTVDIFAPGENISVLESGGMYVDGWEGTSLAAAYVAGTAALLLSQNPSLTPAQLKQIMMQTADTVYSGGQSVFGNYCVSGGRLNAYEALYYSVTHSHSYTYEAVDISSHNKVCLCGYCLNESHDWEIAYMNPDDMSVMSLMPIGSEIVSPQAVAVYRCSECGYISPSMPPDYNG